MWRKRARQISMIKQVEDCFQENNKAVIEKLWCWVSDPNSDMNKWEPGPGPPDKGFKDDSSVCCQVAGTVCSDNPWKPLSTKLSLENHSNRIFLHSNSNTWKLTDESRALEEPETLQSEKWWWRKAERSGVLVREQLFREGTDVITAAFRLFHHSALPAHSAAVCQRIHCVTLRYLTSSSLSPPGSNCLFQTSVIHFTFSCTFGWHKSSKTSCKISFRYQQHLLQSSTSACFSSDTFDRSAGTNAMT